MFPLQKQKESKKYFLTKNFVDKLQQLSSDFPTVLSWLPQKRKLVINDLAALPSILVGSSYSSPQSFFKHLKTLGFSKLRPILPENQTSAQHYNRITYVWKYRFDLKESVQEIKSILANQTRQSREQLDRINQHKNKIDDMLETLIFSVLTGQPSCGSLEEGDTSSSTEARMPLKKNLLQALQGIDKIFQQTKKCTLEAAERVQKVYEKELSTYEKLVKHDASAFK